MSEPSSSRLRMSKVCEESAICGYCGASSAKYKCNRVSYCSVDCQTVAWKGGHKKKCKTVAQQEAANEELRIASRDGNMQTLNAIISAGVADVNSVSPEGYSALIMASVNGHVDTIKALIEGGVNVNYATLAAPGVPLDGVGYTALLCAAQNGHSMAVKILDAAGANVNHVKKTGHSALIMASQNGHVDAIKALVEGGSNVNYAILDGPGVDPKNVGVTALIWASQERHSVAVKILIAAGRKEGTLNLNTQYRR